jgi:hypothetical protein
VLTDALAVSAEEVPGPAQGVLAGAVPSPVPLPVPSTGSPGPVRARSVTPLSDGASWAAPGRRRSSCGSGSKTEVRPGVWKLTVSAGRFEDGSIRRVHSNMRADTSDEAARALAAFVTEVHDSRLPDTKSDRDITVNEAIERFLSEYLVEEKGRDHNTVQNYRGVHKEWFAAEIGHRRVVDVDEAALDRIFGLMRKAGLSASRLHDARNLYQPFFRWARRRRIIRRTRRRRLRCPREAGAAQPPFDFDARSVAGPLRRRRAHRLHCEGHHGAVPRALDDRAAVLRHRIRRIRSCSRRSASAATSPMRVRWGVEPTRSVKTIVQVPLRSCNTRSLGAVGRPRTRLSTLGNGVPASLGPPEGRAQDIATVPATCTSLAACMSQISYVTSNGAGPQQRFNPSWSPDGRRIACVELVPGDETRPPSGDIWTVRPDGSRRHQVSTSPRVDFRPDWGLANYSPS